LEKHFEIFAKAYIFVMSFTLKNITNLIKKMANRILVNNGDKKKLKEQFGCSYPTVSAALNGKETTSIHNRIREAALKLGGVEVLPKES